jgi:hypothetical protein
MNRVALNRLLLQADAMQLNAMLSETKKVNATVDIPLQAPKELLDLTEQCMQSQILEYKVYAMLIWIVFSQAVQDYFAKDVAAVKYASWLNMLTAKFDMHLYGLKADGSLYQSCDDLQMARCVVFVRDVIGLYTDM